MTNRAVAALMLIVASGLGTGARADSERTLHAFAGGTDGAGPSSDLIADPSGALYGLTSHGGDGTPGLWDGNGTVYMLTRPLPGSSSWGETVLYRFAPDHDGSAPGGKLLRDAGGALYGAAWAGGLGVGPNNSGYGTIFKLTPPAGARTRWTEKILYKFSGVGGGAHPNGGLIADASGALYGTTSSGGRGISFPGSGNGVVFKLTPPTGGNAGWTETVLHRFAGGEDGAFAQAGLTAGPHGTLFGTTDFGGHDGYGTVFKLTPPSADDPEWREQVLHSFTGGADGAYSLATLARAPATGALYGTTILGGNIAACAPIYGGLPGCGVVFELRPPTAADATWKFNVIWSFAGAPRDGNGVFAGVTRTASGQLGGTTGRGGSGNCTTDIGVSGCGTVFRVSPPAPGSSVWTETLLWSFPNSGGLQSPQSSPLVRGHGLVGFVKNAGTADPNGLGAVFDIVR